MDPSDIPFDLDEETRDVQARARAFTEEILFPLEDEAERRHGRCPTTSSPTSSARRSPAG